LSISGSSAFYPGREDRVETARGIERAELRYTLLHG
jgi:hypothetical protein